jgi:NAD(P) transhydrogenase subunit alpha
MTTAQHSGNAPESNAAPKSQHIGVPKEIFPGEKRVATVPDVVTKLIKLGFSVVVEQGAGDLADLPDEA